MDLIEQTADGTDKTQARGITRIYAHGTDLVRVRVHRDFYKDQSYAVAEVMSSDRKWTDLTHAPREQWWEYTRNPQCGLAVVADDLAKRAAKILDAVAR